MREPAVWILGGFVVGIAVLVWLSVRLNRPHPGTHAIGGPRLDVGSMNLVDEPTDVGWDWDVPTLAFISGDETDELPAFSGRSDGGQARPTGLGWVYTRNDGTGVPVSAPVVERTAFDMALEREVREWMRAQDDDTTNYIASMRLVTA